jgi:hypothetical protein
MRTLVSAVTHVLVSASLHRNNIKATIKKQRAAPVDLLP